MLGSSAHTMSLISYIAICCTHTHAHAILLLRVFVCYFIHTAAAAAYMYVFHVIARVEKVDILLLGVNVLLHRVVFFMVEVWVRC